MNRKPVVYGSSGQQQLLRSGDPLQLPAAVAGAATLNMPHGTAPTSPIDGDVWTTSLGLYVRVSGATIGPLSASSGGGSYQPLNAYLSAISAAPDASFSSVVLLSGFEGANNSTSFIDESSSPHTLTAVGNAKITTTGSKFGSSCGTFDGSGDWISSPDSADWDFGSGQFTIEGWFNFSTKQNNQALLGQWDNGGYGPNSAWFLYITGGALDFRVSFGGFVDLSFTWAPTLGTWYHIAVDRDGSGKTRLYINGAMVASSTSQSGTITNSSGSLTIGAIGTTASFSSYDFNGQMDEVRVTKGVARYATDSSFVLPTLAYPRGSSGFFYQSGVGAGVISSLQALAAIAGTSGGGTTSFLRADGTWAVPPGTGGGSSTFHGVRATKSAVQAIAASTLTLVTWNAEDFDTDSFHDTSTNTDRITIPAGFSNYFVNVTANLQSNFSSAGTFEVEIHQYSSGGTLKNTWAERAYGQGWRASGVTTGPVKVASGDYFNAWYYSFTTGGNIETSSSFSLAVIGS